MIRSSMGDDFNIWGNALDTWQLGAQVLHQLQGNVDPASFTKAVEVLAGCRGRIAVAGVGTSSAAARKIAHTLSCIERPAFFLPPGDAVHGGLGAVQPGDVAILISKRGGTREIINLLPALKTKRVYIIAVTENEASILARQSDQLLKIKVEREGDDFNMLATTSTMAVIAVFDAVCVTLIKLTGYTREQFAVIHPGGAVGDRLRGHDSEGSHPA